MRMNRVLISLLLYAGTGMLPALNAQEIQWLSWEEAQSLNAKEPRKFIVDVYTQWCGWCKKMDKATFGQQTIAEYINKHYYAVKFDAETKTDIEFNDKVYKYVRSGHSGYHELALDLTFGKLSYPTIVFLDEQLNVLQPIPGYKDAQSLDKIMKYFAENYHRTTPWKKFEEMYHSNRLPPEPPSPPKSDKDKK